MHKKGFVVWDIAIWVYRFLYMILVILMTVFFVNVMYTSEVNIQGTASGVYTQQFLYSRNSISYEDPLTLRAYPGIIDIERLNTSRLSEAFVLENKELFGARFTLKQFPETENLVAQAYYNQQWFERVAPLSTLSVQGPGGAYLVTQNYLVRYLDATHEEHTGVLTVEVATANA